MGIEAGVTDFMGTVLANGGGGSSGASADQFQMAGRDPDPSMPTRSANGGFTGGPGSGGGGAIFLGPGTDGMDGVNGMQSSDIGGGGGGGGTGLFRVFPVSLGNAFVGLKVSPTPI